MSYGCQKLDRFAESEFWPDSTFRPKSGFWQNFTMTSPETLNSKVAVHELSFLLVIHMVYSDAQFDRYEILKLGRGDENFLDILDRPVNNQVLRAEDARILVRVLYKFRRPLIFGNHSSGYSHVRSSAVTVKQKSKWFGLRVGYNF
jgi:hypothetical protein